MASPRRLVKSFATSEAGHTRDRSQLSRAVLPASDELDVQLLGRSGKEVMVVPGYSWYDFVLLANDPDLPFPL
jgi:hypothetical protein